MLEERAKNSAWARAFKELFGENAILSGGTNPFLDRDAELMGYKPVVLNSSVASHLHQEGVLFTSQIQIEQEYKWVDRSQLTEFERQLVEQVGTLNQIVLGSSMHVDVRIYEGLFTTTGREIESSQGVHVKELFGQRYIGIK
jgi:hypothetical protein